VDQRLRPRKRRGRCRTVEPDWAATPCSPACSKVPDHAAEAEPDSPDPPARHPAFELVDAGLEVGK
jgi:hypothetical protein